MEAARLGLPKEHRDETIIQLAAGSDRVAVLSDKTNVFLISTGKVVKLEWKVKVPSAHCLCFDSDGMSILVATTAGEVIEIDDHGKLDVALKDLPKTPSFITASRTHIAVSFNDVKGGSLIVVYDKLSKSLAKIEDTHDGDITFLQFHKAHLYSSGVDGLVCEYSGDCELEQVWNCEASVKAFSVDKKRVAAITDIHTAAVFMRQSDECVLYSDLRGKDALFTVAVKGNVVFCCNCDGQSSLFKLKGNSKSAAKKIVDLNGHKDFVQDAVMLSNGQWVSGDDQMVVIFWDPESY